MEYVGLDVHKKHIQACVKDSKGNKLAESRFLNTKKELDSFLATLTDADITLEASGIYEHVFDAIEAGGFKARLADPLKTKAIAWARKKTDKIDARTLADLNRAGLIAECYVPPKPIRELRTILRHRAALTKIQTELKNRVHALLAKENLACPHSDLFGRSSLEWLSKAELRESSRFAVNNFVGAQRCIRVLIDRTSEHIDELAASTPEARLLDTIPGIAAYSAMIVLAEIGDIKRFPDSRKLCSYAGLVPSVHQSGNHCYHGRITKQGSAWLRWVLIESSIHAIRKPNALQRMYVRIAKRKGHKVAITAVARKMLVYIYVMLSESKEWEELRVNKAG